ncbi:MAG: threonine synthase [Gammaproteobacteria bacterium]|nr:threonine synthase [Rhodocyclaceae bacterium]MBU3909117.1 threonine synthase [Gammaproteobacteria bacterium]MBU3988123.1 threonine synthase [Gammaproteobacteria bacterium]MBU4003328.1 threonine synthase [Gammaproteobacteria bacterium]MBU4022160.1 threonine synthase [Gammaproteobacteria bacterium]
MKYISTRGGAAPQNFSDILLGGLAADGGLYLPETYPQVSAAELAEWRDLPYAGLALRILEKFIDDIPAATLQNLVERSYTADAFRHARPGCNANDITPLTTLEPGLHLLELSNGPTLAFKDMAMQLLGNLFEHVLAERGATINILGATSGDTGSAAEYAMRGKHGVRVFMLSPHGLMSAFQRAQMYSLQEPNIFNIAIEAMFDDCQDIVKAVSNDAAFKAKYKIGAVNSINWARVLAQIVYYFKGYFAATRSNDELVSFAVPSGNFGNICAGHIAHQMGLPIHRLVLATNENDVLDEFFRTGVYRPRGASDTWVTSSPSMDISKASNFERFVFDLVGRDPAVVRELWAKVDTGGSFDLNGTPYIARLADFRFVSGKSIHADRLATIRAVWQQHQLMIDTHTADALKVAREQREAGIPMIVLETAQPVKFAETIQEALGCDPLRPADFDGIEKLPQRVAVMKADVQAVKDFIVRHCT